jgi:hypothetical protein
MIPFHDLARREIGADPSARPDHCPNLGGSASTPNGLVIISIRIEEAIGEGGAMRRSR